MMPNQRKQIIATLIKAGRKDLANEVSRQVRAAKPKLGPNIDKAIDMTREFIGTADNDEFENPTGYHTSKNVDKMRPHLQTMVTAIQSAAKECAKAADSILVGPDADGDDALRNDADDLAEAWYEVEGAARKMGMMIRR